MDDGDWAKLDWVFLKGAVGLMGWAEVSYCSNVCAAFLCCGTAADAAQERNRTKTKTNNDLARLFYVCSTHVFIRTHMCFHVDPSLIKYNKNYKRMQWLFRQAKIY